MRGQAQYSFFLQQTHNSKYGTCISIILTTTVKVIIREILVQGKCLHTLKVNIYTCTHTAVGSIWFDTDFLSEGLVLMYGGAQSSA